MRVNIACCDDEKEQIQYYKKLFSNYEVRHEIELEIDYFLSGDFLLESVRNGNVYDIIFLDMEMPGLSGLDIAREIRTIRGKDTRIIFLTSYAEYMQDSFDVRAFHYMIKPVEFQEFERKFKDALDDFVKDEENVSVFKCEEDEIVVRTKDIIYIEKCKSERQLSLHLQDEILRVKGNLNTMEENLLKKHFLRIHRAVLVNMRHIKRIRKAEVLLSNGEVVPVSRRKEVAIKEYFMKYAIMERNR